MKKTTIIIGIYKITSPSGRIYIGQSCDIILRWGFYNRLECKNQCELYDSFVEHGVKNHTFEIIHISELLDLTKTEIINELNKLEINYIKEFDCYFYDNENGLNLTRGGDNKEMSEETRKKIADKHRGKIVSDETRKKQSDKKKDKKPSPESVQKGIETKRRKKEEAINNGTYKKRTLSLETRIKQSESKKGKPTWNKGVKGQKAWNKDIKMSEEQTVNMRNPKSEEHKKSMRKPKSQEHNRKNSESHKGQVAWNKGIPMSEESIVKREATKKRNREEKLMKVIRKNTRINNHISRRNKKIIRQEKLTMIF